LLDSLLFGFRSPKTERPKWLAEPPNSRSASYAFRVDHAEAQAETFLKPGLLSLRSYTMTIRLHYRTIGSYRELPPRWRYVEDRRDKNDPELYLGQMDQLLYDAQAKIMPGWPSPGERSSDLVSMVFANQTVAREIGSRHLADLIAERRQLADKHLRDLQWRLDALLERRPLHAPHLSIAPQQEKLANELERQILDLERQKRDVQVTLWRDTLELRRALLTERQENSETQKRMAYLAPANVHDMPSRYGPPPMDGGNPYGGP